MGKTTLLFSVLFFVGCHSIRNSIVEIKNECALNYLVGIQKSNLYSAVRKSFIDTFKTWRSNIEIFGVPDYLNYQLDELVFFSRDMRQSLLILLSRTEVDSLAFGGARIIIGVQGLNGWVFNANQEFNFDNSYFGKYDINSFENISELARYSVLMSGNPPRTGCEIDESYWFR